MINVTFERRHDEVWGASRELSWRGSSQGRGEDAGPAAAWCTLRKTVRTPELLGDGPRERMVKMRSERQQRQELGAAHIQGKRKTTEGFGRKNDGYWLIF